MIKLQVQPNYWSCLPTAFAMAVDIPVNRLINLIGHDGGEIISPNEAEPMNRRAFHIQEIVDALYKEDWLVVSIETLPQLDIEQGPIWEEKQAYIRLNKYLNNHVGVLTGIIIGKKVRHAVCWSPYQKIIYDPNGSRYKLDRLTIEHFYIVHKIG